MPKKLDKIILGTAQFGMKYGITNRGKIKSSEIFRILSFPLHLRFAGVSIVPFFDAFGAPIPTPIIFWCSDNSLSIVLISFII